MRARIDTEALLALWERALEQPPSARGDALLSVSSGPGEAVRSLGERNARLVELHARLFGPVMDLLSHCPACALPAQFAVDCAALVDSMKPTGLTAAPHHLEAHGHRIEFRLPESTDVAVVSADSEDDEFAQRLLERCVLACSRGDDGVTVRDLPTPVLDALSQRMEALDPGASVRFSLDCPQCAASWQASLDVGDFVWQKVRLAAERVLLDIDALARAYGWTEREVLGLSPLRRAAYLQLASA